MVVSNLFPTWWLLAKNNFQNQLLTPSSSFLFIVGKLFNFAFTVLVIMAIFTTVSTVKGYNLSQAVIVVLVYNLIESLSGFFFRSIYTFRPVLLRGDFDLDLLKPLPSFFRPLLSGPDFLDFPPLLIQSIALLYYLNILQINLTLHTLLSFFLFLTISLIIIFSIHLFIAAICLLTTEVDNLIWIFRSFMRAGAVPTDIYTGFFQFILNFIVPITLIVTVPAKALLSLIDFNTLIYSVFLSFILVFLSIRFWRYALRHYSSAGS